MKKGIIGGLAMLALASPAFADDSVMGLTTIFQSYNGVTERCVRIAPLPSAQYDKDDIEDEAALCGLDLDNPEIAICPKIWNSSAAIMLYDISEGKFAGDRFGFQTEICAGGKVAKHIANDVLARLKFTMNQASTSSTFAPSPILYYHMSRYFGFETTVPVAVWRSVDKSVLLNEVALGGQFLTADTEHLARNNAAWDTLVEAIQRPDTYVRLGSFGSASDFLTQDGTSAYGTLYDGGGTQYGPEINGAVEYGTTEDRYDSLLHTPVVLALNADLPLPEAIAEGLLKGGSEFTYEDRKTPSITPVQMAFWMREMSEILMIDTIMAQQDRPGNIDHREYFYWEADGKIERKRVRDRVRGDGNIPLNAQILRRTWLNDNDSAGRTEYDNHMATLKVIENLRHFDAGVYERLQSLHADFRAQGPIYLWLRGSIGLDESQTEMIVANTAMVALALKSNLDQGRLRLDLDPKEFFLSATSNQ